MDERRLESAPASADANTMEMETREVTERRIPKPLQGTTFIPSVQNASSANPLSQTGLIRARDGTACALCSFEMIDAIYGTYARPELRYFTGIFDYVRPIEILDEVNSIERVRIVHAACAKFKKLTKPQRRKAWTDLFQAEKSEYVWRDESVKDLAERTRAFVKSRQENTYAHTENPGCLTKTPVDHAEKAIGSIKSAKSYPWSKPQLIQETHKKVSQKGKIITPSGLAETSTEKIENTPNITAIRMSLNSYENGLWPTLFRTGSIPVLQDPNMTLSDARDLKGRLIEENARKIIRIRDGDACALCGYEMILSAAKSSMPQEYQMFVASVDHVVRRREPNSHSNFGNLRLTHVVCNNAREQSSQRRKEIWSRAFGLPQDSLVWQDEPAESIMRKSLALVSKIPAYPKHKPSKGVSTKHKVEPIYLGENMSEEEEFEDLPPEVEAALITSAAASYHSTESESNAETFAQYLHNVVSHYTKLG